MVQNKEATVRPASVERDEERRTAVVCEACTQLLILEEPEPFRSAQLLGDRPPRSVASRDHCAPAALRSVAAIFRSASRSGKLFRHASTIVRWGAGSAKFRSLRPRASTFTA